jgi:hypothetical protein
VTFPGHHGEEALARQPAVIWLHGDTLTVEYEETPLAQYTVRYQPDHKHFKDVPETKQFETPIAHHRAISQSWMTPCGIWPNVSLIMLPEGDGENRASTFSPHSWKSHKARSQQREAAQAPSLGLEPLAASPLRFTVVN